MRTLVKHALAATGPRDPLTIKGWVRTRRDSKGFSFLELNDGSCLTSIQVVVDAGTPGHEHIAQFTTGASAIVEGSLVPSPASGQKWAAGSGAGAGWGQSPFKSHNVLDDGSPPV